MKGVLFSFECIKHQFSNRKNYECISILKILIKIYEQDCVFLAEKIIKCSKGGGGMLD